MEKPYTFRLPCVASVFVFAFIFVSHSATVHVANDAHVNKRAFRLHCVWPPFIVNNNAVISHKPNGFGYGNEAGERKKEREFMLNMRENESSKAFSFQSI